MKTTEWIRCPVCGNKTRVQIRRRYRVKEFSALLPQMQTGNIDRSQGLTSSRHHRARRIRRRADEQVSTLSRSLLALF